MAKGYPTGHEDLMIQFAIWLGLPENARQADEGSIQKFADKYKVCEKTLDNWKKKPRVQEIAKNALKIMGGNDKSAVIDALVKKAKEGNVSAIHEYLLWQGELADVKKYDQLPTKYNVTIKRT